MPGAENVAIPAGDLPARFGVGIGYQERLASFRDDNENQRLGLQTADCGKPLLGLLGHHRADEHTDYRGGRVGKCGVRCQGGH